MGNRAVIRLENKNEVAIYLHWNGGVESVLAFLEAAKKFGVRDPLQDSYGMARLTQIVCNFFGGTLSVGLGLPERLDEDNYDNGSYILGPNWTIAKRLFTKDQRKQVTDLAGKELDYYAGVLEETIKKNAALFKER